MKFGAKIFSWFYGLILVVGVVVAAVASVAARERLTFEYVSRYRTLGAALAESFTQMEAFGERVSLNALQVLRGIEAEHGLPNNDELDELARRLGVTSFYITDDAGRFIRSSDTPLEAQTPSIFGFCEDYGLLLTGGSDAEITPIGPGNPTPRPTKFTAIANAEKNKILEASYDLEFIGKILAKVVHGDRDVISAALFSPNGLLLGEMDSGGQLNWKKRGQPFDPWFGERLSVSGTEFSIRVPASVRNCCECRIDGVARENVDYHYILRMRVSSATLLKDIARVRSAIAAVTVVAGIVAAFLAHVLSRHLVAGLQQIEQTATDIIAGSVLTERVPTPPGRDEVSRLAKTFNLMMDSLQEAVGKSVEAERLATIERVASQVAHDIRSPLAAIRMVVTDLTQVPEETRCLMRSAVFRMEDIANHLLLVCKGRDADAAETSAHLASDLVQSLVSEKRTEHRPKLGVTIETEIGTSAYGAFVQVDLTRLKSVLSNLVNNAVEALADQRGHVVVGLYLDELRVVVEVRDDGHGMPQEVCDRLGKVEVSYGKDGGNGIGVVSSHRTVESWGGSLVYESVVGKGTTARISLPVAESPPWFCPDLILRANTTVIVLDDDVSIHHIWSERFSDCHDVDVMHLSTPENLAAWLQSPNRRDPELFLMDHELLGFSQDGLALIEAHGLQQRAVLVTSRSQEASVIGHAQSIGVRIVPKSAAPYIPIRHMIVGKNGHMPVILIDDDHLVRRLWAAVAGGYNKTVYAFESLAHFLKVADGVEKETPIYIDMNLGDGERGDKGAEMLHERGFERIYYATGDVVRPEDVPIWISGVCGKEGPFKPGGKPDSADR